MKKSIYFLMMFILLAFTSCEPMDDIYEDLDAEIKNSSVVGTVNYTLTDDDYDALDLNFGNFSSIDDAKILIPNLLNDLYPVWGEGSLANVSFKLYSPKQDEKSLVVYTVDTEDYDAYEETEKYDNFDDMDQIYTFLNDKFPNLDNRTLVSLTYKFFDGRVNTLNDGFLFVDGEFQFIPGLTDDEYELVGEGFPNFSSEDEADIKLPLLLKDKYKFEILEDGDIKPIMYKLYTTDVEDVDGDGSTSDRTTYSYIKYFIYNGSSFMPYDNTVSQSIQFGNIDGVWVPDNTIQYSFINEDYALVASELMDVYPSQASNLENYGNFNRGGGSTSWDDNMMLTAINVVLNNLEPNAEFGQKYVVSYVIYSGGYSIETNSVIKTDDGTWEFN